VNKKLAAALSGGAVLLMALSACSSDNKANDWANAFCGKAQPQLKKIRDADASITSASANDAPADIQKTDSAAFQSLSEAYQSLATAVKSAGELPVDGGQKIQQDAVSELNTTAKSYADLKTMTDALDVKDQAKFASGLEDVASGLQKLTGSGDDALKKLQSGDLGKAFQSQSGCKKNVPSPSSSGS
jgi:soluble cytochrome b562